MGSVLRAVSSAPPRDPVQRQQGLVYLRYERSPPPGGWTGNRLAQSQHHTGAIFLALSAVQTAMAGASAWCERRLRRDRTTFGPGGAVGVVKALSPRGGAGNDEDYAPERDHVLADILARPNPNETFGGLLGYQTLQWGLTGNGPLWLVPGAGHGRPVELYPLVEALLQPAYGPSEQYPQGAWRVTPYYPSGTGWAYGTLANRVLASTILPGTEVRKHKAPHPLIRTDGYSPLSACGVQFDIMEAIDVSRHSAFMQGAQLGTIIFVPGASEPEVERVHAEVNQKYGGPNNARKLSVVSSQPGSGGGAGEFKVEQLGESPREMDYAASWEQATRFVLATFGVHAAIAGLKDTSGYAELYAAREQFHGRMSDVAKGFADFYTHHLAGPWCSEPGEYRIKIQLPEPRNKEQRNQQTVQLGQMGALPLNDMLRALDFAPVQGGDLPLALYLKKLEAETFPQAQTQTADAPPDTPDDGAVAAAEEPDDSPEAVQNAAVRAALDALGVPPEADAGADEREVEPDDETLEKALSARTGQLKDGVFTDKNGRKFRMAGGKRVPLGGAGAGAVAEHKRQSTAKPPAGGASKTPPPLPAAYHDALARKLLDGAPALNLLGPDLKAHKITDGESVRAFLAKGGKLPDAHATLAAKGVPATTPAARNVLLSVHLWVDAQAEKHADRVAAHFGVDRDKAKQILAQAIRQIVGAAVKNGGRASGTITGPGGKTLRIAATRPAGSGATGAKPSNPAAKGTLPPRPRVGTGVAKALAPTGAAVRPELVDLLAALSGEG